MEVTLEDMERELAEAERRLREDVKIGMPTEHLLPWTLDSLRHVPVNAQPSTDSSDNYSNGIASKQKKVTFANTPQVIQRSKVQIGADNSNYEEGNNYENSFPESQHQDNVATAAASALKMARELSERRERDQRVLQMLREQENELAFQNKKRQEQRFLEHQQQQQQHERQRQEQHNDNVGNQQQYNQQHTDIAQHRYLLDRNHQQQQHKHHNNQVEGTNYKNVRSAPGNYQPSAFDDDVYLSSVSVECKVFARRSGVSE